MSKTIVYCADGTWNGPGGDDAQEKDRPKRSNVYLLFRLLEGDTVPDPDGVAGLKREQKVLKGPDGAKVQLAMYAHGVGSNSLLPYMQFLGGAFGSGLTTRIRLGYAYISRNYEPGDKIVLVGFSRGSYTARALADMIATIGLLKPDLAADHRTISWSAAAWMRHRQGLSEQYPLSTIPTWSMEMHRQLLQGLGKDLAPDQLVPASVAAVAVWDTVGAMGIPRYDRKQASRVDDYAFASTTLHPNIERAMHAVSVDEQRRDFAPTLWDPDPRVTQELFPGGHADVGGGYPAHRLSDVPLVWMVDRLRSEVGLRFKPVDSAEISPDALAVGHRAWMSPIYVRLGNRLRTFPAGYAAVNDAVRQRMAAPAVQPDPETPATKYDPSNIKDLLGR